nr:T9SS type A sorting domain-containing protein [Chitinophagaceae bacterium]
PCSANDQKWQRVNAEVDLSNFSAGNYTLEIYFEISGQQGSTTGCSQTQFDSNGGTNFRTDFSVTPALPVRLLYFQGRRTAQADQLNWATASEENFSHFLVERSEDGHRFSNIGRVNGAGTSQVKRAYSFAAPTSTTARYYRLQQVDKDGSVAYSAIVLLRQPGSAINVAPNPAKDWLMINGTSGAERLSIYNQLGQSVVSLQAAAQQTRISIAHLPAGRYFLQLQSGSGVEQYSFVKE